MAEHTTPQRDDDLLIERFRSGDPDAFRCLFDRCAAELISRIQRQVYGGMRRRESVMDVLQDVQLAAFESRATLKDCGVDGFRRWILGIAANRLLRAQERHLAAKRDLSRERTRGRRADTVAVPSPQPSPSQFAVAEELRQRTQDAIDALPEPYRQVVRLAHGEGLELRTIADRIGRSYHATRKIHARAMLRLSAVLLPASPTRTT